MLIKKVTCCEQLITKQKPFLSVEIRARLMNFRIARTEV